MKAGPACPYSWNMPPALPGQSQTVPPQPELADLCSTRRQSQIAASRKYSAIWLLRDWVQRVGRIRPAGLPIANNHADLRIRMY
jgi:hypothetical protein